MEKRRSPQCRHHPHPHHPRRRYDGRIRKSKLYDTSLENNKAVVQGMENLEPGRSRVRAGCSPCLHVLTCIRLTLLLLEKLLLLLNLFPKLADSLLQFLLLPLGLFNRIAPAQLRPGKSCAAIHQTRTERLCNQYANEAVDI